MSTSEIRIGGARLDTALSRYNHSLENKAALREIAHAILAAAAEQSVTEEQVRGMIDEKLNVTVWCKRNLSLADDDPPPPDDTKEPPEEFPDIPVDPPPPSDFAEECEEWAGFADMAQEWDYKKGYVEESFRFRDFAKWLRSLPTRQAPSEDAKSDAAFVMSIRFASKSDHEHRKQVAANILCGYTPPTSSEQAEEDARIVEAAGKKIGADAVPDGSNNWTGRNFDEELLRIASNIRTGRYAQGASEREELLHSRLDTARTVIDNTERELRQARKELREMKAPPPDAALREKMEKALFLLRQARESIHPTSDDIAVAKIEGAEEIVRAEAERPALKREVTAQDRRDAYKLTGLARDIDLLRNPEDQTMSALGYRLTQGAGYARDIAARLEGGKEE